jgi:hypothetical protein
LQIDDVLLPNHGWDAASHTIDMDPKAMIRMTPDDAARAARWSRSRDLRIYLVCNGAGSERHARVAGIDADPLLSSLLARRDEFGWINHTYEHVNLDDASRATIEADIERNRSWAQRVGIDLEVGALITGEHSGLANLAVAPPRGENPQLAAALEVRGGCTGSGGKPDLCHGDEQRSSPALLPPEQPRRRWIARGSGRRAAPVLRAARRGSGSLLAIRHA